METTRQTDAPSPESHGEQSTIVALAALERFIVDNDDLLELESRIGKFNIFDALGIARRELQHSNFLAFILDPAESHGQGQIFLKALLMDLLKDAPAKLRPLSPIDLDGTDLRGVEVRREWKNLDLLITCKDPRFAVVIENKVGASEHSDQLSRYKKIMSEQYPELPSLYVFLTPDGEEASEVTWVPYTYEAIYRVMRRIRDTYYQAIGEDVLVFLDHYLTLLGTRFMNDEKLDELCRRIHKNHRQALDLIWERVGSPGSGICSEVLGVLENDARWEVVWHTGIQMNFVPKAWLGWLPPLGIDYDDDRIWLVIKLRQFGGGLDYWVEMQGMSDTSKRKEITERLIDEAPKCGFKRRSGTKFGDRFTMISGREQVMKWKEDETPEIDALCTALKKRLDELEPKLQKLALILKPYCGAKETSD